MWTSMDVEVDVEVDAEVEVDGDVHVGAEVDVVVDGPGRCPGNVFSPSRGIGMLLGPVELSRLIAWRAPCALQKKALDTLS